MNASEFAAVRIRRHHEEEWYEAGVAQLSRINRNQVALELRDTDNFPFQPGESLEVHLPVGACFDAVLESREGSFLTFKVIRQLDPAKCEDGAEFPGA